MDNELYYERCAGIDVHKNKLTVCLRIGRNPTIREFGTLTKDIREVVVWLKENNCQMTAMESSGSYWKPVYNIFEQEGLPAMVCNAYHVKNVPGRKTDKNDARWLAKCLSQGMLNPSFIPDREQRELRDMTRFRKSQVEERARNVNRLQKFLEGANIKLGSWLSSVEGKSATLLLELVIGKPDFTQEEVAARMHKNLKSSSEAIFNSLEGCMTDMQREFFAHIMSVIREQTVQIEKTEAMIQRMLNDNYKAAIEALDAIPGIGRVSAEQIVVETGIDMSRFKDQKSLCKWAGVCPGNNESAGKRKNSRTSPGNKTLKTTLTQCASVAKKNKNSFFGAQYSRLVSHLGKRRATMAVAHSMLIAIYFVLCGNEFKDLGGDYYTQFNREKKINSHVRQLSKLGVLLPDDIMREAIREALIAVPDDMSDHSA
jgi:transposase